ncbi:MAG: BolA family transcriptional regulator [Verrucomicrobia bacterium]|nr:BolA family transcriptional regulator [Verrucomicrobiota bacterium]MDA1087277.1 BolA family transcriptional regulator [Verrucomicrobiota bacterium]
MTDKIREIINSAVPGATTYVVSPDGTHFEALVISPAFEGLSLVKQHQMVMRALKEAFAESVHALQLKTFTPQKWEAEKQSYSVE